MRYRWFAYPLKCPWWIVVFVDFPRHLLHCRFLLKQAKTCMVLLSLWKVIASFWAEYDFQDQLRKFQAFSYLLDTLLK